MTIKAISTRRVAVPSSASNNTATSTLTVTHKGHTITEVVVGMNIQHTFDGDLVVHVISPKGTRVPLVNQAGGSGDNFEDTIFDDKAGTLISNGNAPFTGRFQPISPLSAFKGEDPHGTWTLEIKDVADQDTGDLYSWFVNIKTQNPVIVEVEKESYKIVKESLEIAKAFKKVQAFINCVGGGWNDYEKLLRCGGFVLPPVPGPIGVDAEFAEPSVLDELMGRLEPDVSALVAEVAAEIQRERLDKAVSDLQAAVAD